MADQNHADDEENMECIKSAYKIVMMYAKLGRSHMGPSGRADLVNEPCD